MPRTAAPAARRLTGMDGMKIVDLDRDTIKQGLADQLDGWISTAEDSGIKGFTRSLRQDVEAVHAALTLP